MRLISRNRLRASRFLFFVVMALGKVGSEAVAAEPPPSSSMILQELRAFRECGSVLYIAAHPDDENTQFLAYLARGRGVRTGYLSLTRGEGGQDLIGPEIGDPLGVIRTQELLAARRIDGAEQFFTRARDFGFSKSYEQTLAKWGKQEVLSDVVQIIRAFQPDVIVTRFPPEPGGTHGHHTASTVLALEAFKLSGDDKAFTEQFGENFGLSTWQPKRIFWNSYRSESTSRPNLKLDIGGYLPFFGQSIGEIAALSRSSHRSQGYGTVATRGPRLEEFQPLDGKPAGKDLFDGIDTSWRRFDGGGRLDDMIGDIIVQFNPDDPAASVPALLALRTQLHNVGTTLKFGRRKAAQLDNIVRDCLGLYLETTVSRIDLVPGEEMKYRRLAIMRSASPVPVVWRGINELGPRYTIDDPANEKERRREVELSPNQPVVRETNDLVVNGPLSQPYWLREEKTADGGQFADSWFPSISDPEEQPWLAWYDAVYLFKIGSQDFEFPVATLHITADPAKGEVRERVLVVPPISLALGNGVQLFAPESERTVEVEVKAFRPDQTGTLKLVAPSGWTVAPDSQEFHLAAVGDHARLAFTVHAPAQPGTANLTAVATVDAYIYNTGRQEIRYDHIPFQLLQPPARLKAICLDLQIRGKQIGYLPGAGDKTAEALEAMGYAVTTLSGVDLTAERLRAFDAVVVGVRAFNVRTDLAAGLPALFAYVENGGTVVEQYNTPGELKTTKLAPYALELSRNLPQQRVTDENAPVTLLAPDHPVFNVPNRITATDFDGWVQERGLNFPVTWDPEHFEALLACSDAGEPPLKSGLLVAHHGKGYFVYTGLSFFRQLPAGVPGAYRLFANLVSLGK